MKEWVVKFLYEYEGYSGFDHHASTEYIVKAKDENAALKKAEKKLTKEVNPQSILSYEIKEL